MHCMLSFTYSSFALYYNMCIPCLLPALPTTPPLTLTTQSPGNTGSSAGGRTTNLGAIAGGVIVVISALIAVAMAVVFFIFWFVFIQIIASTKNTIIISCFVYIGGGVRQYKQAAVPSAKKHPPITVAYSKRFKQDDIGLKDLAKQ